MCCFWCLCLTYEGAFHVIYLHHSFDNINRIEGQFYRTIFICCTKILKSSILYLVGKRVEGMPWRKPAVIVYMQGIHIFHLYSINDPMQWSTNNWWLELNVLNWMVSSKPPTRVEWKAFSVFLTEFGLSKVSLSCCLEIYYLKNKPHTQNEQWNVVALS